MTSLTRHPTIHPLADTNTISKSPNAPREPNNYPHHTRDCPSPHSDPTCPRREDGERRKGRTQGSGRRDGKGSQGIPWRDEGGSERSARPYFGSAEEDRDEIQVSSAR
ncbi:hypothetical protein JAAARDRAFT_522887 [Jaapia argillacea MUCL 33604]|uniref:Uncharacterized protein n=1 Tax=Jaapia argillacea MUCL 33604 TaxID=933084 RepID=A0A067Q478_9AGAM|nr:hypothetical protein JAAARDRAFT_522887 [Jaapia argillacea MUCL 33604]